MLELDAAWRSSLTSLMATWVQKHRGARGDTEPRIEILEVEELVEGRPGILDVLANVDGELAHAVLGLRTPAKRFASSEAATTRCSACTKMPSASGWSSTRCSTPSSPPWCSPW